MTVEDIGILFAYNRWANRRVVNAASPLDPQDFVRDLAASHGSVRGTLVHILWGEWLWLQRWRGDSPKSVFDPVQFPDVAALKLRWQTVEREQQDFIGSLTNERLSTLISYQNLQDQTWQYPLAHMMQHIVNHSSYHRGQVITLLRQLREIPPSTDFLVFFDERRE